MFAAVARMAFAVEVPLTADLEAGYGLEPVALVRRMLESGAVGCNLEDTDHDAGRVLREAGEQARWLGEVKRAARAEGVDIVLNARVDVFIRHQSESEDDIREAVWRAKKYLDAGADCIYPILVHHEQTIAELARSIPAPINVFAMPDTPPLARLRELGVKRVSFAGRLQRAAMLDLENRLKLIASGQNPF
jgi:2-methylisocitrate lyase-like PEP mutase family enzyme